MKRVRKLVPVGLLLCALALAGAAPRTSGSFPAAASFSNAQQITLPDGVVIVSQPSWDLPLIGAQVFVPLGLAQQPLDKTGVAALTAELVMHTAVEGDKSLMAVAASAGATLRYTLEPFETRYYLESRSDDFPRLLHDLSAALARP